MDNSKFLSANKIQFSKILITQDFLRIEDGKKEIFQTPFKRNSKWMYSLVGSQIVKALKQEYEFLFGDEGGQKSLRWNIYSSLGLPFCSASWAHLYEVENKYLESVSGMVVSQFQDSLVVSFEMPESVLDIFTKNNIPYIDFSNHPVRFLPDYMFGIRTNVREWFMRINSLAIDEPTIYQFARMTQAKASRITVFDNVDDVSVLFLGQMPIDSSLICSGSIATEETVREELLKASIKYPSVWYKPHPHNKTIGDIVNFCSSLKIRIADFNIYDCFGCGKFVKVIGLSSGGIYEAKYFGLETERLLKKPYYFEDRSDETLFYVPIYKDCLKPEFWEHVLNSSDSVFKKSFLDPYEGAMKFSLQMKWGR